MNVDRATCQQLFRHGVLKAAVVVPFPMANDLWTMEIERADGVREQLTIARKKDPKTYKTLAAAMTDAGRIGFKEVRVKIPEQH
ncbi:plasmid replication protein RepB [Pseudomonas aeruginosa]|jgi:hypothetical protein|uniref:Plasmid replication protein RepB n=1 Tax=Ectopseudomonas mendocina TaxID=300 RepID=A0ABD7RNY4_ECTME|nr:MULTISPECIES: plasmid replication protein RepB [Pseudomonadaceae]OZB32510.1 MAG: hypothetical protein B7X51_06765 [Pseudomonas sp. 34-62-33]MDC3951705.1 plasmid replication protein RepB [Pseudomonas aeruginosa]MDH1557087.1 plasmid replication protein RepB [Stutzerimonas stutzeri]RNF58186.1 plasmid replication protein RepB [Pseudomonas aeruginosa]TRO07531.1 plasmid replication protein RepB [Pseudomonas mendocina]